MCRLMFPCLQWYPAVPTISLAKVTGFSTNRRLSNAISEASDTMAAPVCWGVLGKGWDFCSRLLSTRLLSTLFVLCTWGLLTRALPKPC